MTWLRWTLTAAFLTVAGYCVVRLVVAGRVPAGYRGAHRAVDVAHVLMGLGMAAMVSPVGGPLPIAGWQTVFLLLTAWFAASWWQGRRTGTVPEPVGWHGNPLHHAAAGVAMLVMLGAMPHDGAHAAAPWMAAMPDGDAGTLVAVLAWTLAAYFLAAAAVRLVQTGWRRSCPAGEVPALLLAPRLTSACEVTMALGTGYLLVATL